MPVRVVRNVVAVIASLALAACGSSTPTTTPPPPPPGPGAPASVAVISGDGQSALPGTILPVTLAVVVRDSAGTVVPGVSVHFAVDSGGGSITVATATTGSDGTASAGSWTLGLATGVQVASAFVSNGPSAKFHATALGPATQAIFTNAAVGTGGGTLTYTKAGDPLNGLSITVPAGAYTAASQWTVTADPSVTITLPSGFSVAAPVLIISNGQGFADSVMTLTMPMSVADDQALVPFYYDVVTQTLEAIPLSDRTASYATLATQHFSADLMAIPRAGGGAGAGSLRRSFGEVRIVWVKTVIFSLVGTFTSGFTPGVDDWEFSNRGDYISPDGDCEGMSVTAMYYHYFVRKAGGPPLFHHFDTSLSDQWDNLQGIRFAGSVQGDYEDAWHTGPFQVDALIQQGLDHGSKAEWFTANWILLTLKLTHNPVLINLVRNGGGHAVVAYAATSTGSHTEVSVADPNNPGATSFRMTFESGVVTPVSFASTDGGTSFVYPRVYAIGVTADLPFSKIAARYAEFRNGTAGADRYPHSYTFEVFDELTNTWGALGQTIETTNQTLNTRLNCADCPIKNPDGSGVQLVTYWLPDGSAFAAQNPMQLTASGSHMLVGYGRSPSPGIALVFGFVDTKSVAVTYHPFELLPAYSEVPLNTIVHFTAHPHEFGTFDATYIWGFGDGTPAITLTGDSTASHLYTGEGDYTATVQFRNGSGKLLARRTAEVIAHPPIAASIIPSPIQTKPDDPVTLTAHVTGASALPHTFRWEFEAGTPPFSTSDTTLSYSRQTVGTYPLTLFVFSAKTGLLIASATTTVTVKVYPATWRLTSLTLLSSSAAAGGSLPRWLVGLARMDSYFSQAITTPSDGLMFVEDGQQFTEHAFYFQVTPPGVGINALYAVPGGMLTTLARVLSLGLGDFYTTVGPVTSGTIDGSGATSQFVGTDGEVPLVNTIHATKTATGLQGTISYEILNNGGRRVYSFLATRINP